MTEDSTAVTQDLGIRSFIIAAAFGSLLFYNAPNVSPSMNPAVAFSLYMTMLIDHGSHYLKYIWIHMIFPFVGGILSLVFYELIYKKTQDLVNTSFQERNSRREKDQLLGNR